MERIFRLILGISICKKHLYLCFCFFSGGRTSWPSIWSVSKTFVLGVRQKMAEFEPRFLLKTTIKRCFFLQMLELPSIFSFFFFKIYSYRELLNKYFPFYPLKFLNKSLYRSPPHGKDDPFDTHRHSTHQPTNHSYKIGLCHRYKMQL